MFLQANRTPSKANARQFRLQRGELKKMRTDLGRAYRNIGRDIGRKIASDTDMTLRFARLLNLVSCLLAQKPKDKNKPDSLHTPEVVCISKGKARFRYEFGCKVGIVVTNREGLVLGAKAFEGNPDDGHTLSASIEQASTIGGMIPNRIDVDKGHRGHDHREEVAVML